MARESEPTFWFSIVHRVIAKLTRLAVTDPPGWCRHHRRNIYRDMNLHARAQKQVSREPGERGSLPKPLSKPLPSPFFSLLTWTFYVHALMREYRISQTVDPTRGAGSDVTRQNTRIASAVEPCAVPLDAPNRDPDRSRHRTAICR
jgi:hypothetical protein